MRHDFVDYDDGDYVVENAKVSKGLTLENVTWAFSHSHARNWHPLTTMSHMLDCQFFGLRASGHHFTNVLLHTIAVLLLFLVLREMTGGPSSPRDESVSPRRPDRTGSLWRSAFVAALFAIHPQHVESVAWIAERKDVLSGVFFMLTLGAYVRYVRKPSLARYVAMSILFACGLMSKPMLVTVPFVLLLLDCWPLQRTSSAWKLVLEKIPLVALSVASGLVTFLIQKHGGAQSDPLPLALRIENALASYVTYIRQMVWPVNLAPFYPHPGDLLSLWRVALAFAILLAISIIAVLQQRKNPYLATGWFWYLVMLLPVIGIVQVGAQGWADRYTYLPQIGLFILVSWGIVDLTARWRYRREILAVASVLAIGALGWISWIQISHWRDSESLWTHTLAVTSNNEVAHNNLGNLLLKRGQTDDALSHYEKALEIRSGRQTSRYDFLLALFHSNVGIVLGQKGRWNDAIEHYQKAIQLQPDYANAYLNLGHALIDTGRIDNAIAVLRQAVAVQPDDLQTHIALAGALRRRGMEEEMIVQYERALEIDPQSIAALNNLAWVFATSANPSIRNGSKAVGLAEQAVRLSGGEDPFFLQKLAAAYAENGNFPRALEVAERALEFARRKNNPALFYELERNVALYLTNTPLRDTSPTNAQP